MNAVDDGFATDAWQRHDFDLVESRAAVASATSILAPGKIGVVPSADDGRRRFGPEPYTKDMG